MKKAAAVFIALLSRLREHFPLTLQGVISLSLALLALQVFGYGRLDLVVFALGVCAIAIVVFSMLSVIVGGVIMQFRVRQRLLEMDSSKPIKVEAGFPNETGFTLAAFNFFPLVKLSWQVIYPDYIGTRISIGDGGRTVIEEIVPHRRCKTGRIVRMFTVSDVLGFCRYCWRQGQSASLMALPRSNTINALPLLRSLTAEDGIPSSSGNPEGDRMEIRPYVPGDSVRNIMWKVYARTGELNVRLPERSVFHSNRTVAYLLSGGNDEAAAAVARVAIESGALGDNWVFSADGTETPCDNRQSALEAIAASRALDRPFHYGLDNFLAVTAEQSGCHCIVFAAAEQGQWIAPLKHSIARFRGRFSVVLATDGFSDEATKPLWQRLLWKEGMAMNRDSDEFTATGFSTATPRSQLAPLLAELSRLVESTLVVDRNTGLSFDNRLRRV
ncbi:MAG: DUF58 domain-containing protein [Pseudohongiellaceae bacterium]